jgi:hypothetical protein
MFVVIARKEFLCYSLLIAVSSKNLREGSENLLPGKELGIGSVIYYYGSDESVNIESTKITNFP